MERMLMTDFKEMANKIWSVADLLRRQPISP